MTSACSKEFNRKELLHVNLLSTVLDNLDDGKIKKKKRVTSSSRPCFIFKRARHVCVLAERTQETSHQIAVLVART